MTDDQLKQITDRLDLIKDILEETFKTMNRNHTQTQKSISSAADGIQAMTMMSADDIGEAVARAIASKGR
jgi:hypothetical protein